MSKIMDRVLDLQSVDWATIPVSQLNQWEQEALSHDRNCRCHKCALFFARMTPRTFEASLGCAITRDIVQTLRGILGRLNKL